MCCRSVLPYEGGCVGLGVVLVLSPSATVVVGVGSASVVGVGYSAGVGGAVLSRSVAFWERLSPAAAIFGGVQWLRMIEIGEGLLCASSPLPCLHRIYRDIAAPDVFLLGFWFP